MITIFIFLSAFLGAQPSDVSNVAPAAQQQELLLREIDRIAQGNPFLAPPVVPRPSRHTPVPPNNAGFAPPQIILPPPPSQPTEKEIEEMLTEVRITVLKIRNQYPENFSKQQLRDAMIRGAFDLLDKHSFLFDPQEMKLFKQSMEVSYGGIGITLGKEKDRPPTVSLTLPNSPAAKEGIAPDDVIMAIDGKETASMTLEQIVSLTRGAMGSKVKLTVVSNQGKTRAPPRTIELTRTTVRLPSVFSKMATPSIAYIYLANFHEDSAKQLQDALIQLRIQKMRALIVDLRNNGGGYIDQARDIASHFLSKGQLIISIREKNKPDDILRSKGGTYLNLPLVILVNSESASASEIVAGVLQDHKKAVIIGSPTFGKGSVQTVTPDIPENGYGIRLTIAKYYLPSGRSIDRDNEGKGGLIPDIEVKVAKDAETIIHIELYKRLMGTTIEKPAPDQTLKIAIGYLETELSKKR